MKGGEYPKAEFPKMFIELREEKLISPGDLQKSGERRNRQKGG